MKRKIDPEMERELLELGQEMNQRRKTIREEWFKTHKRMGRDGGPTQQIKELVREEARRYGEILSRYPPIKEDEPDSEV